MELFEKEIKRLNQNQKFTAFMSDEEETEKLRKTLISEAKTETQIEIAKTYLTRKWTVKILLK